MSAEALDMVLSNAAPLESALKRIEAMLGLRYQQHQWSDLLRLLRPAARELGFKDVARCINWLAHEEVRPEQVRILGKHLTIGESYFFREIVVFSILKSQLLPEIIERKEKHGDTTLRIWSAGCSTGEEVYSLAILLDSFLEEREGWDYLVHGTDINPNALSKAAVGQYREWSFRDLPDGILEKYFSCDEEGRYEVSSRIRQHTEFTYCNLAEAQMDYPKGYDIIFCRNVLMYFTRAKIAEIVQGFRRSVRESGWLIPSLTETTLINNAGFEGVRFGEATMFRKQPNIQNIIPMKQESATQQSSSSPQDQPAVSQWRSSFASILPFGAKQKRAKNSEQGRSNAEQPTSIHEASTEETTDASAGKAHDPLKNVSTTHATRDVTDVLVDSQTNSPAKEKQTDADSAPHVLAANAEKNALVQLAQKLADQGALDEARSTAWMAVEQAKMDPHAHIIYGTILREIGETKSAMDEFHRALYLDHGCVPAHFYLGSLYSHMGETSKARRHFRNALELLDTMDDQDAVIEPGALTVRRMKDIIRTMSGEQ